RRTGVRRKGFARMPTASRVTDSARNGGTALPHIYVLQPLCRIHVPTRPSNQPAPCLRSSRQCALLSAVNDLLALRRKNEISSDRFDQHRGNACEMPIEGNQPAPCLQRGRGNPDVVGGKRGTLSLQDPNQSTVALGDLIGNRTDHDSGLIKKRPELSNIALLQCPGPETRVELSKHHRGNQHLIRPFQEFGDCFLPPFESAIGVRVYANLHAHTSGSMVSKTAIACSNSAACSCVQVPPRSDRSRFFVTVAGTPRAFESRPVIVRLRLCLFFFARALNSLSKA